MTLPVSEMQGSHWLLDMINELEVGLLVLDRHYQVVIWNAFMENHSALTANATVGQSIFALYPDLQDSWFASKLETLFSLGTRGQSNWEQRPYLFPFPAARPITSPLDHMRQNITLLPLRAATGEVTHAGVVVYDVTELAATHYAMRTQPQQA